MPAFPVLPPAAPALPYAGTVPHAWHTFLVEPPRAEGRPAFVGLAIGAAATSWILLAGAAMLAARVALLPAALLGTASLMADSSVLVGLFAILVVMSAAAARAGWTWLGRVRVATGQASIGELLGGLPDPAFGTNPHVAPVRRSARAIVLLPGAGLVLIGVGLALWYGGTDPSLTRAGLFLVIGGSAAFVIAQGIFPSFMRAIERRERIAAPADAYGRRLTVPAEGHPVLGVVLAFGGLAVALVVAAGVGQFGVNDSACSPPDGWSCRSVNVPAIPGTTDARPEMITVAYAVHRADAPVAGDRRVLMIAVGGPGSSGIGDAQSYTSTLPSSIVDRYDLVLFDARGVGASDGRECGAAFEA